MSSGIRSKIVETAALAEDGITGILRLMQKNFDDFNDSYSAQLRDVLESGGYVVAGEVKSCAALGNAQLPSDLVKFRVSAKSACDHIIKARSGDFDTQIKQKH